MGLGTETGVSIRNPAANGSLVGVAPTRGLVPTSGVVPISFTQDRVGPLAKTVNDAARLLQAIVGYDAREPQSALSLGRLPGGDRRLVAVLHDARTHDWEQHAALNGWLSASRAPYADLVRNPPASRVRPSPCRRERR